jgi:hypothetical protein
MEICATHYLYSCSWVAIQPPPNCRHHARHARHEPKLLYDAVWLTRGVLQHIPMLRRQDVFIISNTKHFYRKTHTQPHFGITYTCMTTKQSYENPERSR